MINPKNMVDLREVINAFTSPKNTVITKEIFTLVDKSEDWIELGSTGAIIYGQPRTGKTRAIAYMINNLKKKYGNDYPVALWDGNLMRIGSNPKYFYQSALTSIGSTYAEKDTVIALKQRLVNRIILQGMKYDNRFLLIVDEAQHLNYTDYTALIELYNLAVQNNVHMITLLVGDRRLKAIKENYMEMGYDQIVGRFMLHEIEFKGVTGEMALSLTLKNLDQQLPVKNADSQMIVSRDLFPNAYKNGWRLSDMSSDMWSCFFKICDPEEQGMKEIPMAYLIQALVYIIKHYSSLGDRPADVITPAIIKEAIEYTDYVYTPPMNIVIRGRKKK